MDANVSSAAYEARLREEQSYRKKDEADDDVGNEAARFVRTRSSQQTLPSR
jgi:hypothetical protein